MLNGRVIVNWDFGKKVVSFIGNPLVALIIAIISGFFFYEISINQKLPYYYISKPNLVADRVTDSLKIIFGKRLIKNVYFVDLVIWNNGNEFIDQTDFIESKPICFTFEGPIDLLASDLLVKSRTELKFSNEIFKDSLYIKMRGDEALEQDDGAAFRIFYTLKTSNQPYNFILSSRIKGTKHGFEYKDLKHASKTRHTATVIAGWCVIILLILIRSVTLLLLRKPIIYRMSELVLLFFAIATWSYYTYDYISSAIDLAWFKGM